MGLVDIIQRLYDTLLHPFSLHDGREKFYLKLQAVVVVSQLVTEVAIACRIRRRDDGDALTEHRQLQLALQVEHAFCLKLTDDLLPTASHIAHRVSRVDVVYNPRETISLMEVHMNTKQYL